MRTPPKPSDSARASSRRHAAGRGVAFRLSGSAPHVGAPLRHLLHGPAVDVRRYAQARGQPIASSARTSRPRHVTRRALWPGETDSGSRRPTANSSARRSPAPRSRPRGGEQTPRGVSARRAWAAASHTAHVGDLAVASARRALPRLAPAAWPSQALAAAARRGCISGGSPAARVRAVARRDPQSRCEARADRGGASNSARRGAQPGRERRSVRASAVRVAVAGR